MPRPPIFDPFGVNYQDCYHRREQKNNHDRQNSKITRERIVQAEVIFRIPLNESSLRQQAEGDYYDWRDSLSL